MPQKHIQQEYTVSFNAPAFLGNAEQQAQWRTPPFKALLRQWWRIVKAPQVGYDHQKLLAAENLLFGSAFDQNSSDSQKTPSGQSKVQLRLSKWDADTKSSENFKKKDGVSYLGYGPIAAGRTVIEAKENAKFKLRFPATEAEDIRKAMQLIAWFGTLGSRSRNGWGSLHVQGDHILEFDQLGAQALKERAAMRSLPAALREEWPHAIGLCEDGQAAIWYTKAYEKWEPVIAQLAAIKIEFRTQIKLYGGGSQGPLKNLHILAYPITKHELPGLPSARLANQLRFKITKDNNGKFIGLLTHIPCAMPAAFFDKSPITAPNTKIQIEVWQKVHENLNKNVALTRIS